MIKLYYICSLKSSIFLNFFKLDNQFFCRALKYIILRRKKLDKIILYKFYLILINLIYLLLITEDNYKIIKIFLLFFFSLEARIFLIINLHIKREML